MVLSGIAAIHRHLPAASTNVPMAIIELALRPFARKRERKLENGLLKSHNLQRASLVVRHRRRHFQLEEMEIGHVPIRQQSNAPLNVPRENRNGIEISKLGMSIRFAGDPDLRVRVGG